MAEQTETGKRLIHLLYVPTVFCNLACSYCYLGDQTQPDTTEPDTSEIDTKSAVSTLKYALNYFQNENIIPFNVSLHGGEVTTLPKRVLSELFDCIRQHYLKNFDVFTANGFKKDAPHIKTNLFNFHKLTGLMEENGVSVSGSVDLPLSLHDKYRTTAGGGSTLRQTLENLTLLGTYPHRKRIPSTLYQEHVDHASELIDDIWYLHNDIGFDMNQLNFMFGFQAGMNSPHQMVSDADQVRFYERMNETFTGTELEYGLKRHWFDEFGASYCTNSVNCGDRFFLLQHDGNVYSCVRGQGHDAFYYGNIFHDSADEILTNATRKIAEVHQRLGFDDDCKDCGYLSVCNTGCAFVKQCRNSGKSYTCGLQKLIYRDNPATYPDITEPDEKQYRLEAYTLRAHPDQLVNTGEEKQGRGIERVVLPAELDQGTNSLHKLIEADDVLKRLYSEEDIILDYDDELFHLKSPVLSTERVLFNMNETEKAVLHIKRSLFEVNCSELVRNTLYLQMLRDTSVVYGDDKRTKQEHLFTHQVYYNTLETSSEFGDDCVMFDLSGLFRLHSPMFLNGVINNFFITTGFLREYHYLKQKRNAFYHIQAVNLPFQNIEFYWK